MELSHARHWVVQIRAPRDRCSERRRGSRNERLVEFTRLWAKRGVAFLAANESRIRTSAARPGSPP